MRPVKLTILLVVAVALGWTAGKAVAGEAYRASGSNGTGGGQATLPLGQAGPGRIEGMIIGIARTTTATILTIRVREPHTPKRDIRVELTAQTPIRQGILPRNASDLTIASHVWLDCEQEMGKLKADEIGILDPPVPLMGLESPEEEAS
jgi:hypothetical protein